VGLKMFLFFFLLLGRRFQIRLRLRRFKPDLDETWKDHSPSKYASIDGVGILMWRHNFKMEAMASFREDKCCRLMSAHSAYAAAPATS